MIYIYYMKKTRVAVVQAEPSLFDTRGTIAKMWNLVDELKSLINNTQTECPLI